MNFKQVGIIGAGTMGSGIATTLIEAGVKVILNDNNQASVERGAAQVHKYFSKALDKGKLTAEQFQTIMARLDTSVELSKLASCDLIIEAIFEEFEVKKKLFTALDPLIPNTTVVATNTSALTVSGLAEHFSHPERFMGLHYFNPAAYSPIVEVVRGIQTSPVIYEKALAFIRETGKKPIACLDSYGFAINRFFVPYGNEAMRLLDEKKGTIPQIDRVAKQVLQVAAGPFQVMNLVKPKIMFHAQRNLAPHGSFYTIAPNLMMIGDKDHEFDLSGDDSGIKGGDTEIGNRLLMACFLPILQSIDEKVAIAADIDMGALLALKFGIGPCALMDEMGKDKVTTILKLAVDAYGVAMPKSLQNIGSLLK